MKEIVIIGSGIIGSTIAYELTQYPHLKITLIDEKNPGSGSTGAALGVLMGIISYKTKGRAWRLREESIQRYNSLIPELEALTGLSIPYNRDGIVKLLFPDDDLSKWEKLAQIRSTQGYNLYIWNPSQLKHRCPEINVSGLLGAVYSPDDRQVNPTMLTKALVKGAQLKGVNCIFGEKVVSLTVVDEGSHKYCRQVNLEHRSLSADIVILATGLGTSPLIPDSDILIKPVLGQALLLKYPSWQTQNDFYPVITGNDTHIVPMGNDELWLGATVEFPDENNQLMADEDLLNSLQQTAIEFCPQLVNASVMLSWTGKRPRPEGKSAPIIETLTNHPNIILATGHYRNGILLSPATALSVVEMLKLDRI